MGEEKILIVEDEMDLLDLVDFNLTRKGYRTSGAMSGDDAVSKMESFRPDLVILDLMLPGVDGWEVCRRLRREKNETPVIMLTAKCMPEDKVKGYEAGADDYITKPFDIKELFVKVEKALEGKRTKEGRAL